MGFFNFLSKKSEEKQEERAITGEELLTVLNGGNYITAKQALEIPTVAACLEYIGKKVALLPVKLYRRNNGALEEVKNDIRTRLLNIQPSEYIDGNLFKKMLAKDYVLHGECYAYLKKRYNDIEEIVYVKPADISKSCNSNPLDRKAKFWIVGKKVEDYLLLRAIRDSTDGIYGRGMLKENSQTLINAYSEILFEGKIINKQGMKTGYLSSDNKLTKEALEDLKAKWSKVYNTNNSGETMVLNSGVKFNELNSTPAELQILENKKNNSDLICSLVGVAPSVLAGTASMEVETATFETAVMPVAKALEVAFNNFLLLEKEKEYMFFSFDYDEALRGNMEARFNAYEKGVTNGIYQADEIREKENMPPLGLNFIKMGLQDVLYDPKEKIIYIPNMGKSLKIGEVWNGENRS